MNRVQKTVLFAGMFFLVGMASGTYISPTHRHSAVTGSGAPSLGEDLVLTDNDAEGLIQQDIAELQFDQPVVSTGGDQARPTPAIVDVSPFPVTSGFDAGEAGFAMLAPVSDEVIQTVAATTSVPSGGDDAVLATIEIYFPDLPDDIKAGWLDTYSGMPPDELDCLLQQKKAMHSILPVVGAYTESPGDIDIRSFERAPSDPLELAHETVMQNLRNAFTVGYRRRHTTTAVASSPSGSSGPDIATTVPCFDMRVGPILQSDNCLHLAIEGGPRVMFRLEPGSVLTRNGQFEILDDGQLGIRSQNLVLPGIKSIPADAERITVSKDGTVEYTQTGVVKEAGRVMLVQVQVGEELTSRNGVYFSSAINVSDLSTAELANVSLISGAFEASNVDLETEWQTLEHFERLQRIR